MDASASDDMQRTLVFVLILILMLKRRGTPEALLEPPNIFTTPANVKSHSNFFWGLRTTVRCDARAAAVQVKNEVRSPTCIRGGEIPYNLLECADAKNSTIAGVVG